jgi:hypothetical protein
MSAASVAMTAAVLALLGGGAAPTAATQADAPAVADAVALGLSRDEARRAAFHERYRQRLGGPVLQSIEVITEFRRLVLLAEEQGRQGEAAWGAERAAAALAPYRGRLDLVLRLRFDPRNAYRSMPETALVIYTRGGGDVQPTSLRATPANDAGPVPPAGTPILAATVEAAFPASRIDPGRPSLVGVFLDGRELERIPLDLSALR